MKLLCDIYKGDKKEEMYLYVPKDGGPSNVPEELLKSFGELKLVTTMVLSSFVDGTVYVALPKTRLAKYAVFLTVRSPK